MNINRFFNTCSNINLIENIVERIHNYTYPSLLSYYLFLSAHNDAKILTKNLLQYFTMVAAECPKKIKVKKHATSQIYEINSFYRIQRKILLWKILSRFQHNGSSLMWRDKLLSGIRISFDVFLYKYSCNFASQLLAIKECQFLRLTFKVHAIRTSYLQNRRLN